MSKVRDGFVTNSSSTAFIISNEADTLRSILDFFQDNKEEIMLQLQEEWGLDFTEEEIEESLRIFYPEYMYFNPGESRRCIFGDEDGNPAGYAFDYVLRGIDGKNGWKVRFDEYLR